MASRPASTTKATASELIDTAGGTGTLTVTDASGGTAAKDLRIAGSAATVDVNGVPRQVINGTARATVEVGAEDKLADVVKKINDLKKGVTAALFNDGTGLRLSLTADKTGTAKAVLLDASGFDAFAQRSHLGTRRGAATWHRGHRRAASS